MGPSALDPALFREAMKAYGEPLPPQKRLFYRILLGADWRYAMLCYAYARGVDDTVDSVQDDTTSIALMEAQRRFIESVYAGTWEQDPAVPLARYGLPFFTWDRDRGAPLREQVEAILDTVEFDARRRGRVLSASELDGYVLNTGRPFLRFLAYFATGKPELPDPCLDLGSRAYLYADAFMDLEEDLEVGLINIPANVIEEHEIDLEAPEAGLARWRAIRAAEILEYYRQAQATVSLIDNLSMRLLYRFYLGRKRGRFLRFLRQRGLAR